MLDTEAQRFGFYAAQVGERVALDYAHRLNTANVASVAPMLARCWREARSIAEAAFMVANLLGKGE